MFLLVDDNAKCRVTLDFLIVSTMVRLVADSEVVSVVRPRSLLVEWLINLASAGILRLARLSENAECL